MLQADEPDNFVLATNRTETVREFLRMAGASAGFDLFFEGSADQEVAFDKPSGKVVAKVDPAFYRPAEVELLIGNPAKAQAVLGWAPTMKLEQLCQEMVEADLRRVDRGWMF
jgi:GDPmannose 4,6-dehydratase